MTRLGILAAAILAATAPADAMRLSSGDFVDGGALPTAHVYPRCGGQNVSPSFAWNGAPKDTKSFVFTMIDHSVPPNGWTHWIVVDLPANTGALARGLTSLPAPAQGVTSNFGEATYDGPCPPHGTGVHHYAFTIWAMPSDKTALPPDAKGDAIEATLGKMALDHATIVGNLAAK
jgi:Raf kinase inhibitor-like YbhB/YbcL family protein